MIILKLICLFLAIWFTIVNTVKLIYKNRLPALNLIIQAIGITGYTILQFKLWK